MELVFGLQNEFKEDLPGIFGYAFNSINVAICDARERLRVRALKVMTLINFLSDIQPGKRMRKYLRLGRIWNER